MLSTNPVHFIPFPILYFCFHYKVFDAGYVFNNCWNTYAVSSAKTVSIWFFLFRQRSWNNTAQSFSILFWVRRAVGHTESILFWYWNWVRTTSFCTTFREITFLTDYVLNRNHSSFVLWNHFRGIFGDPGNSFSQYPLQNINQEGFCLCFSRSLEITNISRVNAEIFGSEWISNFWKLKWYLKLLNPRSRILRKFFCVLFSKNWVHPCLSRRTFSTHPIYNF